MQTAERHPDTDLDARLVEARTRGRLSHGRELRQWQFMRISGLVLVFLALIHFSITHIVNDVIETDFAFVVARWENPLWRLFDWVLLALALTHGTFGIQTISEDYIANARRRTAVKTLLYLVVGVLLARRTVPVRTLDG